MWFSVLELYFESWQSGLFDIGKKLTLLTIITFNWYMKSGQYMALTQGKPQGNFCATLFLWYDVSCHL